MAGDIVAVPGLVEVYFEDRQDGDELARQGDGGHGAYPQQFDRA